MMRKIGILESTNKNFHQNVSAITVIVDGGWLSVQYIMPNHVYVGIIIG